MNFLDYIKGNRKGENAHRIEKESMKDPFLYEAIDGYDSVSDDHSVRLDELRERLNFKVSPQKKTIPIFRQIAAACVILVVSISAFLVINTAGNGDLYAQNSSMELIEIYVPNDYYEENIAIIAQNNTTQIQKYRPQVVRFSVSDDIIKHTPTEDNIQLLAEYKVQEDAPIEIYQPEEKQNVPVAKAKKDLSLMQMSVHKQTSKLAPSASARKKESLAVAEPIIGFEKYAEYIDKEKEIPQDSECRDISGDIILAFEVNEDGSPINIKLVQGICKSCDNEAIRLIENGPKWKTSASAARVAVITIKF